MSEERMNEFNVEDIKVIMERLIGRAKMCRTIKEAVDKGVPMHIPNHKSYIVPVALINDELGCERMPRYVVPLLRELGWSRNTRAVCSDGKFERFVSCWIYQQ